MEELRLFGSYKAKVSLKLIERIRGRPNGKLICVSSMTPTAAGEGKTVTAIALTEALGLLKKKVMLCLGQPVASGLFTGGGNTAGAGYAQLLPGDEINLHFTGDLHAVQTAANFLASVLDNHRLRGNALGIEPGATFWRRTADPYDWALADNAETSFESASSSEIMSLLTLSKSLSELKARLGRAVVGLGKNGKPVTVQDLKAAGALALFLRDAIEPNLVQTLDGLPCLIHAGSSGTLASPGIAALETALKLADYVVLETSHGTDIGLERFFDILAPRFRIEPNLVLIVATVRALRGQSESGAFEKGFENLAKHVENVRQYGVEPLVVLNRFSEDTDADFRLILDTLRLKQIEAVTALPVQKGGEGALELGEAALKILARKSKGLRPLVAETSKIADKCREIAQRVYGAQDVIFAPQAQRDLELCEKLGLGTASVQIAKTPFSLTDDPARRGAPRDWKLKISRIRIQAGAGIVTAHAGVPAPQVPAESLYERFDVDDTGRMVETAS